MCAHGGNPCGIRDHPRLCPRAACLTAGLPAEPNGHLSKQALIELSSAFRHLLSSAFGVQLGCFRVRRHSGRISSIDVGKLPRTGLLDRFAEWAAK